MTCNLAIGIRCEISIVGLNWWCLMRFQNTTLACFSFFAHLLSISVDFSSLPSASRTSTRPYGTRAKRIYRNTICFFCTIANLEPSIAKHCHHSINRRILRCQNDFEEIFFISSKSDFFDMYCFAWGQIRNEGGHYINGSDGVDEKAHLNLTASYRTEATIGGGYVDHFTIFFWRTRVQ